jgi:nucleotide-binding universal stress UspA family protein
MQRILVASDLSARSDRAVERALGLAEQHQAVLSVLHAIDDELPARVTERLESEAHATLHALLQSLPIAARVDCTVEVRYGRHADTIVERAEALDADLIVLGKHRSGGILDFFRGSTGERIVRASSHPVLVVKERAAQPYERFLAAVDFSPPSRKALEFAWMLAPQAEALLVHAYDVPFSGLLFGGASMDELAKKHQRQFQDLVETQIGDFLRDLPRRLERSAVEAREGTPEVVVPQMIAARSPDLLVVGTHGRSGLGRALLGSVAETLLAHAACDVLAVRGW